MDPKIMTNIVGEGKTKNVYQMLCHCCNRNNQNTVDCFAIMRAKQHKKAQSEAKDVPGNKALAFPFEEIDSLEKCLKPPEKGTISNRGKLSLSSLRIFI
jgi:hypothetical protein